MASRRRAGGNTAKEVDVDAMVVSGSQGAYEALQLYRSRAIRYKTKNDNQNAILTLNQGAKVLFLHSYKNAGAELANLLVDFLTELGEEVTSAQVDMILELNTLFDVTKESPEGVAVTDDNHHNHFSNKLEFLKNSVKWSSKYGTYESGDSKLNIALGLCLWETPLPKKPVANPANPNMASVMENYTKALQVYSVNKSSAIYHLVCGEAPFQLNQVIQSIPVTTQPVGSEMEKGIITKDRALTLGVLTFLSLENLKDANELLNYYRLSRAGELNNETAADGTKRSGSPTAATKHKKTTSHATAAANDKFEFATESELEKFCRYLLLTCHRDAAPLFKTLVNTYAKILDYDENVPALLTGPIGLKFFNIQQKQQINPMMNMLQQMLSK